MDSAGMKGTSRKLADYRVGRPRWVSVEVLKPHADGPTTGRTGPVAGPARFPTRMSIPHLRNAATAAAAFLLVLPAYAYGASAATGENTPLNLPSSDPKPLSSGGGGGSLVRTFVGLAIVI